MNSVIAGERWIASRGWEGIARAGKINPAAAGGGLPRLLCIFYVVGLFFFYTRKKGSSCAQVPLGDRKGGKKGNRGRKVVFDD